MVIPPTKDLVIEAPSIIEILVVSLGTIDMPYLNAPCTNALSAAIFIIFYFILTSSWNSTNSCSSHSKKPLSHC